MASVTSTLDLKLGNVSAVVNQASGIIKSKLSGLDGVNKSFGNLKSSFAPLAPYANAAFGAVALAAKVAAAGAAASLAGIGLSINKAAEMETLETAFVPLLGGIDQAKARMAELSKFAASTPFDLPQVTRASTVLETLTAGALSTGEGLKMVGDVAATSGQPFDLIATHVGRLYDGLQNGRPVGEAMARLQELGVISSGTRAKIEAMQKTGQKGDAVWGVASEAMGRFSGAMEAQSGTWNGQMSNLMDNIGMTMAAFGAPIMDALKPYLTSLSEFIESLGAKAAALGQTIADGVNFMSAAFASGKLWDLVKMGLQLAFFSSVNYLLKLLVAGFAAVFSYVGENLKTALAVLAVATQPDFWKGLGITLLGIAGQFGNKLLEFVASLIGALDFLPGVGGQLKDAASSIRSFAQGNSQAAGDVTATGMDLLAPHMQTLQNRQDETMGNIGNAFSQAMERTPDLLGTSDLSGELASLATSIQTAARTDSAQREAMRRQDLNKLGGKPSVAGEEGGSDAAGGKGRPTASRLTAISGFGVFVKDPILAENRRQSQLLEKIAKNTEAKQSENRPVPDLTLRFS